MSDADRRVPTAADVERWGHQWLYRPHGLLPVVIEVVKVGGVLQGQWVTSYFPVKDFPGTWLGPVNPEPLPWPEGGR